MNKLIFFIIIALACCQQQINLAKKCSCSQLSSQFECKQNSFCDWIVSQSLCKEQSTTSDLQAFQTSSVSHYCEGQPSQSTCIELSGCSWVNEVCSFFTSCTPFEKQSFEECQGISKRCVTDGDKCIEKDLCKNYVSQLSCYQSITGYCYWDETSKKCTDISKCSQLPKTFNSDFECRQQLKGICTAINGGGCTESGINCADQVSKLGCITNKAQTIKCFWNDKCFDKKCENAPTTFSTNSECVDFLPECIIKVGGGCMVRAKCIDIMIKEGCLKDVHNNDCYWTDNNKCVDKTCQNASNKLLTNLDCQTYLSTCITNSNGCVDDISCSSAVSEDSCLQNRLINTNCTWSDGSCKIKSCENAGSKYKSHEECSNYSQQCTGNQNRCQQRTCENAPQTLSSSSDCENYLPNKKCIGQKNGGCITNTTCEAIKISSSCLKDSLDQECYWDSVQNYCITKQCSLLPVRLNTHELCNGASLNCTVGVDSKCIDMTCSNILEKQYCLKDKNQQPCIYKSYYCLALKCSDADVNIFTSHSLCQQFFNSCTLSQTKKGCISLPEECGQLIQESCFIKKNGGKCTWNESKCVEQTCSLAPSKIDNQNYTNEECFLFNQIGNCVVSDDLKGCSELKQNCNDRKNIWQCQAYRNYNKYCLWDSVNLICVEKSCSNAIKSGFINNLALNNQQISHSDCQNWILAQGIPQCVVGKTNNLCIDYPSDCTNLGQNSCFNNIIKVNNVYLNCYWNSAQSKCLDGTICSNLNENNHLDCFTKSQKKCTVSVDGKSCIDLGTCSSYVTFNQCQKSSTGSLCSWTGNQNDTNKCDNFSCSNSVTAEYTTEDQCHGFSQFCGLNQIYCSSKKKSCAEYTTSDQCPSNTLDNLQQCEWSIDKCQNSSVTFDCTKVKATGLSYTTCNYYNSNCSATSDQTSCTIIQNYCSSYSQNDCSTAKSEYYCLYSYSSMVMKNMCYGISSGAASCQPLSKANCELTPYCSYSDALAKCIYNCSLLPENSTQYDCQGFSQSCQVRRDNKGCYFYSYNYCADITDTNFCMKSIQEGVCYVKNNQCHSISYFKSSGDPCTTITGNSIIDTYCVGFGCTVNISNTQCVTAFASCSGYSGSNISGCYSTQYANGRCIVDPNDQTKCIDYANQSCESIKAPGSEKFTHSGCASYNKSCTVNLTGTACLTGSRIKQCSLYKYKISLSTCLRYSLTCSVNSTNTSCIDAQNLCSGYSDEQQCVYSIKEGECSWDGSTCSQKGCSQITLSDLSGSATVQSCALKQSNCTVASKDTLVKGCRIIGQNCTDYKTVEYCTQSLSGAQCYWSQTQSKCLDKTCSNADVSTSYDSHVECQSVLSTCTVKAAADGTLQQGCISFTTCSNYTNQEQCHISSSGNECSWNLSAIPPACQDKSCATANPSTYKTHQDCQTYYIQGLCTVDVILSGGKNTLGGCRALGLCSDYVMEEQCKISLIYVSIGFHQKCEWSYSTSTCQIAKPTCYMADDSYTTAMSCINYNIFLNCTIDSDNKGCIPNLSSCEEMNQNQCIDGSVDLTNNQCYWDLNSKSCKMKNCGNVVNPQEQSDCSNYAQNCGIKPYDQKCQLKSCNDYNLSTDSECAALYPNRKCTSDGKSCYDRLSCPEILFSIGCNVDISNKQCEWIVSTDSNKPSYCGYKTCDTARTSLTTEADCQQYFQPQDGQCTTQKNGGCTLKSTCQNANTPNACTFDINNVQCAWNSSKNYCKIADCDDFVGSNSEECNLKNCAFGGNNKCATKKMCAKIQTSEACIIGIDGPCLWVPQFNQTGACIPFMSCSSVKGIKDEICKQISDQCTTDGTKCIGITKCQFTNLKGGCVTGTDGQCLQSVSSLKGNDLTCKKFSTCSDGYYLTHQECQQANKNCTTNGETGCAELSACSSYSKISCFKDNKGKVLDSNNGVISTGNCVWDLLNNKCRAEICKDFKYSTHALCKNVLSNCTSDGAYCITQQTCSAYTQDACEKVVSSEGQCFWVQQTNKNPGICRKKVCSDIQNGSKQDVCNQLEGCITDGQNCIQLSNCEKYQTQIACNNQQNSNICVWTQTTQKTGKCSQMNSCSDANNDKIACLSGKDRCLWKETTQSQTNQ